MPDYLNGSNCLVLASEWGSPNIVKEALAVDLLVVSVGVGDVCELFSEVEGLTITDRTAGALARAIVDVLKSHKRANSSHLIAAQYGIVTSARHIANIYQNAWNH